MAEKPKRLVPVPYEKAKGSSAYTSITEQLKQLPVRRGLENALTQQFGPLTVRERWGMFDGNAALQRARENTNLEGSAAMVANEFLRFCTDYGFPANVALLHLLDATSGLETIAPGLKSHVDTLLIPEE